MPCHPQSSGFYPRSSSRFSFHQAGAEGSIFEDEFLRWKKSRQVIDKKLDSA